MKKLLAFIGLFFSIGVHAADLIAVCSGTYSLNPDNTISCDSWQLVSYTPSPFDISDADRDDFILAASGFLIACYAGRMLIRNLNPSGALKGD